MTIPTHTPTPDPAACCPRDHTMTIPTHTPTAAARETTP